MKRRADTLTTWKPGGSFMRLVGVARARHAVRPAEADKFWELKGLIVQELEVILAFGECAFRGTG